MEDNPNVREERIFMNNDELTHYGRKGMKWGRKIFSRSAKVARQARRENDKDFKRTAATKQSEFKTAQAASRLKQANDNAAAIRVTVDAASKANVYKAQKQANKLNNSSRKEVLNNQKKVNKYNRVEQEKSKRYDNKAKRKLHQDQDQDRNAARKERIKDAKLKRQLQKEAADNAEKRSRRKEKEERRRYDVEMKAKAKDAERKVKQEQVKASVNKLQDNHQTNVKLNPKDYKHMSDADLRSVNARMQAEKQYRELNSPPPTITKRVLEVAKKGAGVMEAVGGAQAMYDAGRTLAGKPPKATKKSKMSTDDMAKAVRDAKLKSEYDKYYGKTSNPYADMADNIAKIIKNMK